MAIPILILSSIVNGLIIGNMALYITELNKKNADFQQKMDTVNTAMKTLNLSSDLVREITEYFITTNSTSELQKELNEFMRKRISQTYRILCSIQIFKTAVQNNHITQHLFKKDNALYDQDVLTNIVKRMETVLKMPEEYLCTQNEELATAEQKRNQERDNDHVYFIAKGKCQVTIKDTFKDR